MTGNKSVEALRRGTKTLEGYGCITDPGDGFIGVCARHHCASNMCYLLHANYASIKVIFKGLTWEKWRAKQKDFFDKQKLRIHKQQITARNVKR